MKLSLWYNHNAVPKIVIAKVNSRLMYHKQNEIQHLEIKYEPRKIVCEWFLPFYPSLSALSKIYILFSRLQSNGSK